MNNDSFGNVQLGVCYLHIRDPLLKSLAQLWRRIRGGRRGQGSFGMGGEVSRRAVTSDLIRAQVVGRRSRWGPAAEQPRGSEIYFPSAEYIISILAFSRSCKSP